MKKNDLINIVTTKMKVTLEGKHTKSTLIKQILEYQEKTTAKQIVSKNIKETTKKTFCKNKQKRYVFQKVFRQIA